MSGAAEAIRLSAEATGDVDGNRDDIIDNESLRLAVRIYAK